MPRGDRFSVSSAGSQWHRTSSEGRTLEHCDRQPSFDEGMGSWKRRRSGGAADAVSLERPAAARFPQVRRFHPRFAHPIRRRSDRLASWLGLILVLMDAKLCLANVVPVDPIWSLVATLIILGITVAASIAVPWRPVADDLPQGR